MGQNNLAHGKEEKVGFVLGDIGQAVTGTADHYMVCKTEHILRGKGRAVYRMAKEKG